jgi:hypothetical protein
LIAIDVNSGKSTNSYSIEETALRTNLEAGEEIARQLRLRDLAGLIVIDFIDMEDYGNVRNVERKMRDFLRADKARLQTAPISTFGLMEMTRQRLRPAMKDLMSVSCDHCQGMGFVLSLETSALRVLRAVFEEIAQKPIAEVSVNCTIDIAHYLLNKKRKEILAVEQEYDLTIHINGLSKYARLEYDIETTLKDPTKITKIPKAYQEDDYEEQIIETETETESVPIADDAVLDDEPYKGRRLRDNKRRNSRRGERSDKVEPLDTLSSPVIDDLAESSQKLPYNKGRNSKYNDKRSLFNRKRGRFDVVLSETADVFVTASGSEVVIENRVSVNYPTQIVQTPLSEVCVRQESFDVSDDIDTHFVETVPAQIVDDVFVDTQHQFRNGAAAYHATHTIPDDDGEVLTHLDTRPIQETSSKVTAKIDDSLGETFVSDGLELTNIPQTPVETPIEKTEESVEQKSARRGWWRNRFGL